MENLAGKFSVLKVLLFAFCGLLFSTTSQAAFSCVAPHPFRPKPTSFKAYRDQAPLSAAAKEEARHKARWLLTKLESTLGSEVVFKQEFIEKVERLVNDARQSTARADLESKKLSDDSLSAEARFQAEGRFQAMLEYRDQSTAMLTRLLKRSEHFGYLEVNGFPAYAEFLIDAGAFRNLVLNEKHALYLLLFWKGRILNPEAQQILREIQSTLEPLNRG